MAEGPQIYWPANYLGNLKCSSSRKYGPKLLPKITQAICQLNINSFWQLQNLLSSLLLPHMFVYMYLYLLYALWTSYEMHTDAHFSYCVFHKFLFAVSSRMTKSHKCFSVCQQRPTWKATVIAMKCPSVRVYLCVSVSVSLFLWTCLCMSVGLLKIYFKYIEIAFSLQRAQQSWHKQRTLWQLQKNYCILLGCSIKHTSFFCPEGAGAGNESISNEFHMTKCVLCIFMHCQWPLIWSWANKKYKQTSK